MVQTSDLIMEHHKIRAAYHGAPTNIGRNQLSDDSSSENDSNDNVDVEAKMSMEDDGGEQSVDAESPTQEQNHVPKWVLRLNSWWQNKDNDETFTAISPEEDYHKKHSVIKNLAMLHNFI
jgi:hypothetical protein